MHYKLHTYESITTLDMLHMLDVLGIPKKTGSTADGHRLIGQGTWWTTCRRPRQRRTLWIWEAAQDGSPCWWRGGNSKVQHDVLQEWNDNDCETYHSCTIYIYTYINIHYICLCMWYHYHWYKICIFLPGMINSQCLGCFAQPPAVSENGAYRAATHNMAIHGNFCGENEWTWGVLNQYR